MIEFIVMLPSLCGNISEKHEIDEGSLSKEEKNLLSFGCSLCLTTDVFCLKIATHMGSKCQGRCLARTAFQWLTKPSCQLTLYFNFKLT